MVQVKKALVFQDLLMKLFAFFSGISNFMQVSILIGFFYETRAKYGIKLFQIFLFYKINVRD